ncbi:Uncharacterised protein [Bordetella pertussis]|nr:Uncharacterised protein [Bordetella pertussis]CFO67951.1 Uncharacterised protein [Bordetella pertussis]CFU80744.1 Uncharacterised protein [Bordetella pertussis]CPH82020.1 Uncharacterised protein [Bordetella pertussis]CPK65920.1 Uncharacterised protein [Bordetella pertussis]
MKSLTVKKPSRFLWANSSITTMTPIRPPWNDMPPSHR